MLRNPPCLTLREYAPFGEEAGIHLIDSRTNTKVA
jgi:hypothetical protein